TPSLDTRLRTLHGETQIATVHEGGSAHAAGLSAGDMLLAINGLRVSDAASVDRLLGAYKPADSVDIHVFRRDELRAFQVKLAEPGAHECVLERKSTDANAAQP